MAIVGKSYVKVTTSKAMASLLKDYNMRIAVGIHSAEGRQQHGEVEDGETPVKLIDVAVENEFGLGVPQRSFVRGWTDENKASNSALAVKQLTKVFDGVDQPNRVDITRDLEKALERVSLTYEADMRARIHAGIRPENAPSTIAKKGSATPLVDTGQLQAAIRAVGTVKPIRRVKT